LSDNNLLSLVCLNFLALKNKALRLVEAVFVDVLAVFFWFVVLSPSTILRLRCGMLGGLKLTDLSLEILNDNGLLGNLELRDKLSCYCCDKSELIICLLLLLFDSLDCDV